MARDSYVELTRVVDFVDRTTSYGVPLRVAVRRAERRFGVPRKMVLHAVLAVPTSERTGVRQ